MRTKAIAVLFVVFAWLATLTTGAASKYFGARIATGPSLPLLSGGAKSCVQSSPLNLLLVLGIAGIGILLAEGAKIVSRSPVLIASVAAFQVVLLLDCVRAYARDWWSYFYVIGTGGAMDSLISMSSIPVSAVGWPWISGITGLLAVAVGLLRKPGAQSD